MTQIRQMTADFFYIRHAELATVIPSAVEGSLHFGRDDVRMLQDEVGKEARYGNLCLKEKTPSLCVSVFK